MGEGDAERSDGQQKEHCDTDHLDSHPLYKVGASAGKCTCVDHNRFDKLTLLLWLAVLQSDGQWCTRW